MAAGEKGEDGDGDNSAREGGYVSVQLEVELGRDFGAWGGFSVRRHFLAV